MKQAGIAGLQCLFPGEKSHSTRAALLLERATTRVDIIRGHDPPVPKNFSHSLRLTKKGGVKKERREE